MEINLVNFGVFLNKTVRFNPGVTFLSGKNGAGKSTILRAITYAISPNERANPHHGWEKRKSSVTLTLPDITIVRSTLPKHVEVEFQGKTYTGMDAQSVIDHYFGVSSHLLCVLRQKGDQSILSMSPADKASLFKSLLFHQDISAYYTKMKAFEKDCATTISSTKGILVGLSHHAVLQPSTPLAEVELRLQSIEEELEELTPIWKDLQVQKQRYLTYTRDSERWQYELEHLRTRLEDLSYTPSMVDIDLLSSQIRENEEYQAALEEWTRVASLPTTFDAARLEEVERQQIEYQRWVQLRNERATLRLEHVDPVSPEELEQARLYEERERYKYDPLEIERITLQIEQMEEEIKRKDVLVCPHCAQSVLHIGSHLEATTLLPTEVHVNLHQIRDLKRKRDNVLYYKEQYDRYPPLSPPARSYADLLAQSRKYSSQQHARAAEIDAILPTLYTQDQRSLLDQLRIEKYEAQRVAKLQKTLQSKLTPPKTLLDLPLAKEQLYAAKDAKVKEEKWKQISSTILQTEGKLASLEEVADPSLLMKRTEVNIKNCKEDRDIFSKMQTQWDAYLGYRKKVEEFERDLELAEETYKDCLEMTTLIRQAEMNTYTEFIEELNSSLHDTLDVVFPEGNITSYVTTNKQMKNGNDKLQIHIYVERDGVDVKLESLSGGEYDRLNLAYTLALSSYSKFLLLDEALSSVDESAVEIVERIEEYTKGKYVVMTSHRLTSGGENIICL